MNNSLLMDEDFILYLRKAGTDITRQMHTHQHGVGNFFQLTFQKFMKELEAGLAASGSLDNLLEGLPANERSLLEEKLEQLNVINARRKDGRFVTYADRIKHHKGGRSEIGFYETLSSQGQFDCLQWKGLPLFKSVYDYAVLPMLIYEQRPAAILEIGSGTGASAIWMADTLRSLGLPAHIYSMDLHKPSLEYDHVTFLQGDCFNITAFLSTAFLEELPHPLLVIEDAHANVSNVLRYLHGFMRQGDYFFIEDSGPKGEIIAGFLKELGDSYRIDTHYTDLFGKNAVTAVDSILARI